MPSLSRSVSALLQAVTGLELLNPPQEDIRAHLVDEEDLTHPSIGGQTLARNPALIGRGQHDVDLAPLLLPQGDDLVLQEEVLAAVVSEDDDEGAGGGHLQGHHQSLGQPLLAVPPPVVGLELQAGGGQAELTHVVSVDLKDSSELFMNDCIEQALPPL